jgi:hypothetical protein
MLLNLHKHWITFLEKGANQMNTNLSLEQRIQRLEDVEAIKKLQATYGHYVE